MLKDIPLAMINNLKISIMKKLFILLACVAGAAGLYVGHGTPGSSDDLTTENIERLGLSAAEMSCDASHDGDCLLFNNGMIVGRCKGRLTYIH